nr:hypothetical protein [Tanacetum cinerariifolium]
MSLKFIKISNKERKLKDGGEGFSGGKPKLGLRQNPTVQNWYRTPHESLRESGEAMSARHYERPPKARRR